MAAIPAPTKSEVLALCRALLRTARTFADYNIREYAKQRTVAGFRQNQNLADPAAAASAFADGKSQLEVARRQALVYSLYAPRMKTVMEMESR